MPGAVQGDSLVLGDQTRPLKEKQRQADGALGCHG